MNRGAAGCNSDAARGARCSVLGVKRRCAGGKGHHISEVSRGRSSRGRGSTWHLTLHYTRESGRFLRERVGRQLSIRGATRQFRQQLTRPINRLATTRRCHPSLISSRYTSDRRWETPAGMIKRRKRYEIVPAVKPIVSSKPLSAVVCWTTEVNERPNNSNNSGLDHVCFTQRRFFVPYVLSNLKGWLLLFWADDTGGSRKNKNYSRLW